MAAPSYQTEPFYHGLISREDIPCLLREHGDFIVRITETNREEKKKGDGRERDIVISSYHRSVPANEKQPFTFKHTVIYEIGTGNNIKYSLNRVKLYGSVRELINHIIATKEPMNKQHPQYYLIRPIHRQPWELYHENIITVKKLGAGAFGEVWSGKMVWPERKLTIDVAVKVSKTGEQMDKAKIKEVMKEARLMRNYDHPNVVRLYGVCVFKEPLMIVMELVTGGALDEHLKKTECTDEQKRRMVMDTAWGVEYLHMKHCIHRDLASRNCLYQNGMCKISDFGLSREGESYTLKAVRRVPIKWLAPETMTTLTYTKKSDVWSFGVLVWEIYNNGIEPYPNMRNTEVKEKLVKGYRMEIQTGECAKIADIVKSDCWTQDPASRKTMAEVTRLLESATGLRFKDSDDVASAGQEDGPLPPPPTKMEPSQDGDPDNSAVQSDTDSVGSDCGDVVDARDNVVDLLLPAPPSPAVPSAPVHVPIAPAPAPMMQAESGTSTMSKRPEKEKRKEKKKAQTVVTKKPSIKSRLVPVGAHKKKSKKKRED